MNTLDKLRETERRICANIDKHKEGTPEYDEVREGLAKAGERVRWMKEAAGELYDALNAVMPIVLMHAPTSAEGLKAAQALRLAKKGNRGMNKHRQKYVESHREILRNRIEHAIDDYIECTKDRITKIEPYYLRSKCAETDGEVNLLGVEIEYMLDTTCSEKQASESEGGE